MLHIAQWLKLISDEHFTVDCTMIEAWASIKSFVGKDASSPPPENGGRNLTVGFKGEKLANDTHQSTAERTTTKPSATLGADKGYDVAGFVQQTIFTFAACKQTRLGTIFSWRLSCL